MATNGKAKLKAALGGDEKNPGAHMGDVVLPEMHSVEITRSDLQQRFVDEGLPKHLVSAELSVKAALGKAAARFRDPDLGYFTKRSKKRGSEVLLVRQVGRSFETLAVITADDAKKTIVAEPGPDTAAYGVQPGMLDEVTRQQFDQLKTKFDWHRAFADSGELGDLCVSVLLEYCGGIRLKDSGHAYWVPAGSADTVRALDRVITGLGKSDLGVLPVHVTARGHATVQKMAVASFEADLAKLRGKIAEFRENIDKTRPSSVARRLDMFEDIRSKCEFYADILASEQRRLLKDLEEAKADAKALLDDMDGDGELIDDADDGEDLFTSAG